MSDGLLKLIHLTYDFHIHNIYFDLEFMSLFLSYFIVD